MLAMEWLLMVGALTFLFVDEGKALSDVASSLLNDSSSLAINNRLDPCALLASIQSKGIAASGSQDSSVAPHIPLPIHETWQCARSIKFVPDDATKFIAVARQFIPFHTTLAYLKQPPASYLQPAVDVIGELDTITSRVENGSYKLQYEFDRDIWNLMIATHDAHFTMLAGLTNLFSYSLNDSLVAFSSDGKELPRIYAYSDINRTMEGGPAFEPSPINSIENLDPVEYVNHIVNQSRIGAIENHTSWNLMMTDVPFIFGTEGQSYGAFPSSSYFQTRSIYAGECVRGSFANGTTFEWPFEGYVAKPLTNINSGEQLYRDLILVSKPTSNAGSTVLGTIAPPTSMPTAVPYSCYPRNPVVVQDDLGIGGTVSGYLLLNESIGVLSLPSFGSDDTGAPSTTFIAAVASFIEQARSAGVKKIVVDISGNSGGTVLLAYDTFRRFFPNIYPSASWRIRSHPTVQTMGKALAVVANDQTGLFNITDVKAFDHVFHGAFSIAATHLLEARNGITFGSWKAYIGPVIDHGDNFSKTARFNFTDLETASISWKDLDYVAGFGNNTLDYTTPPWAADDIILLTNGMCGDSCSIFAELFKTDAGVKSIVVGGMPQNGPMQGVGGTRGANQLPWEGIAQGATLVKNLLKENDSAEYLKAMDLSSREIEGLPPDVLEAGYEVTGTINMEDAIRASAPTTPLMFTYEPANCRIFFTRSMITDITQVWRAAGRVVGGDYSACVPGSVNVTGSQANETAMFAPPRMPDATNWFLYSSLVKRGHFGSHSHGSNHSSSSGATLGSQPRGCKLAMALTTIAAFALGYF